MPFRRAASFLSSFLLCRFPPGPPLIASHFSSPLYHRRSLTLLCASQHPSRPFPPSTRTTHPLSSDPHRARSLETHRIFKGSKRRRVLCRPWRDFSLTTTFSPSPISHLLVYRLSPYSLCAIVSPFHFLIWYLPSALPPDSTTSVCVSHSMSSRLVWNRSIHYSSGGIKRASSRWWI